MHKIKAELKARVYNSMVKHPDISYRAIDMGNNRYVIAQYYKDVWVGIA